MKSFKKLNTNKKLHKQRKNIIEKYNIKVKLNDFKNLKKNLKHFNQNIYSSLKNAVPENEQIREFIRERNLFFSSFRGIIEYLKMIHPQYNW